MNLTDRTVEAADRVERSAVGVGRSMASLRARIRQSRDRRRAESAKMRLAPGSLEPLVGWSHGDGELDVAVLVYRGVSSAEVEMVGDALAAPLSATVRLVSPEPGELVAVEPARMIEAEPLAAVPRPYGLVIPGGLAWRREVERPELIEWLQGAMAAARGVIAVSTGSLLLAAMGMLDDEPAAGHWLAGDLLAEMGARPSAERFVHGRLLATASGALAGVEAAERLAKEMRFSV
ncbi:MAG: DJ-1/PfpI family protein [Acidimicrobiales bacterium]